MKQTCPKCDSAMNLGYVHAGEDRIRWSATNPEESIDGSDIPLQGLPPQMRSFRMASSISSPALGAMRCEGCRIVVFQYECEYPWR